jgi:hypothetical protein
VFVKWVARVTERNSSDLLMFVLIKYVLLQHSERIYMISIFFTEDKEKQPTN